MTSKTAKSRRKTLAQIVARAQTSQGLAYKLKNYSLKDPDLYRERFIYRCFFASLKARFDALQQRHSDIDLRLAFMMEDYLPKRLEKIAGRKMFLYLDLERAARERLKNGTNRQKWERNKSDNAALLQDVLDLESQAAGAGYPVRIFINWDLPPPQNAAPAHSRPAVTRRPYGEIPCLQ